jgi:hypothetical protein
MSNGHSVDIQMSRASAIWRSRQISPQQNLQWKRVLGTVPGGDGISFSPQTQHFKTGVSRLEG